MNVFGALARARGARRQLVAVERRVRAAQRILDDTAERVVLAQQRLESERGNSALPNVESPSQLDIELLCAVEDWLEARRQLQVPVMEARKTYRDYCDSIKVVRSRRATARVVLSKSARTAFPEHVALAETALGAVSGVLRSRLAKSTLAAVARRRTEPSAALARYRRNGAYLFAAIDHLRDQLAPEPTKAAFSAGLPFEVARQVESTPLMQGAFTSVLRRYQDFGARYAVVQKRVILGDEMGLGKTIQALAAICHLHALGARQFLVVVPNSVLINWQREVASHTDLNTIVCHGAGRESRIRDWRHLGGIAITTFGTLPKLIDLVGSTDLLVVDEAHQVKNPATARTNAVARAASHAEHVIFMTGTALENRLEELKSLVSLVQPQLRGAVESATVHRFPDPDVVTRLLAPVYLRRTQADVLHELPERIHVDEWVDLKDSDRAAYLGAPPNFVQKRLATVVGDGESMSSKYLRLLELVAQHRQSGHKIVVFSFFRQVVADVSRLCNTHFVITGDASAPVRQQVIDAFTTAPAGAVLVSQIDAGGLGVNLQAAQVVILTEAQLKPSTEWQAVARVHRMGQNRAVIVHRLLARDTVEERLVQLLDSKEQEFTAYAHDSAIKHESRMAVDTGRALVHLRSSE